VVPPEHGGARLDVFLAAATRLSRRAARTLIAAGDVLRNGRPVRVLSKTLEPGDVIDLLRPPAELGVPAVPDLVLPDILFEDGWVVVVDKPAGVLSQPAESAADDDVSIDVQLLLGLAVREGRRPFLRLIHRLDRQTSGAVLFARNPQAPAPLAEAWRSGEVDRRYLAVVVGRPPFDRLELERPLGRDPDHRWRFRIDDGGMPAHTSIRVVERRGCEAALVECRLRTGRTHQVRVHLASAGHPVVGDRLYGAPADDRARRPLLHACRLELPHPKTGERLTIESPLPADFVSYLASEDYPETRGR
jgi:23S rRNA pseudouridine1911/1915/1917 synthase